MKPTDPIVYLFYGGGPASRARLRAIFLMLVLLTGLPPAALRAQVANPPQSDTPKPAPPQAATPAPNPQKIETFVERAERRGTAVRLSLKDAMKMALQNNLSIAIQDYSEEIYRSRIFSAAHVYEPHLITGLSWNSQTIPNTSRFNRVDVAGATAYTNRQINWYGRVLQNLPYGGNYTLDFTNGRSVQSPLSNAALFATRYFGNFQLTFNQPLLRDFRNNESFHRLNLVKLDDRINDTQFEEQVTAVIKQVQDLYWELVYAIQFQNIRKRSLDLARVQLENNRRKVEIGILAPISITEASAEEALRVQDMISAENQINNMENNLKRAISKDRTAEIWNQDIIPAETPEVKPVPLDMDEAITTALRNRPELRRIQLKTDQVNVDYQFYRNQKKPRIDFNGVIGTTGQAGAPIPGLDPFIIGPDPTFRGSPYVVVTQGCGTPENPCTLMPNPQIPISQRPNPNYPGQTFIGGAGNLARQLFSAPYRNYAIGVQLDIPLRNRPLEETLAQLSLQRRQNQKQLKDAEQMVVVEVRNALQSIQTNRQVVESARVGSRLAQEQYDAENKRFQAGLSTTFLVLQRQRDLADAEGRLLRAQVDYQKSVNDLQKAKFTTIDQNDMQVAKSQVPPDER